MVDLDSVESYSTFLNQIKYLGLAQSRYNYILVTLASLINTCLLKHLYNNLFILQQIKYFDLDDFQFGGVNIWGFGIKKSINFIICYLIDYKI